MLYNINENNLFHCIKNLYLFVEAYYNFVLNHLFTRAVIQSGFYFCVIFYI